MSDLGNAWLALAGATFGGAGLKIVEVWLNRGVRKDTTASDMRTELRTEVTGLRAELQRAEENSDKWRDKYYDLMDRYLQIKAIVISMGGIPPEETKGERDAEEYKRNGTST